jgi:hypothetical protein
MGRPGTATCEGPTVRRPSKRGVTAARPGAAAATPPLGGFKYWGIGSIIRLESAGLRRDKGVAVPHGDLVWLRSAHCEETMTCIELCWTVDGQKIRDSKNPGQNLDMSSRAGRLLIEFARTSR